MIWFRVFVNTLIDLLRFRVFVITLLVDLL